MPKNLKRLVDDATENYGPGSGWEEEFGEIIAGARVELARYDEAIELLRLAYDSKYQREKVRTIEQVDDLEARAMAFLAAEGKVAG